MSVLAENLADPSKHWQYLDTPGVTAPRGFRAAGLHCGIKYKKPDLAFLLSEVPCTAAGTFTRNLVRAACVDLTAAALRDGRLQALVVNSGNANACTGRQGEEDARTMQVESARLLGIAPDLVAVASTGVIGEPLPMERLKEGIPRVIAELSPQGAHAFAEAILTTDLRTKEVAVSCRIDGVEVRIGGVAKGSGMIHPNMATMLAFITTDAAVEPESWQQLFGRVVDRTFNRITVDGDTSTNDMALGFANGLAGNRSLAPGHPGWETFAGALEAVARYLAREIARDGEGATKLITVEVTGGADEEGATAIARTVAGSSLVKTAVHGADPNWGRILAAAGRAGVPFDPARVDLALGPYPLIQGGAPLPVNLGALADYLAGDEIVITLNLHAGSAESTAYGCDLSDGYVRINASYRT